MTKPLETRGNTRRDLGAVNIWTKLRREVALEKDLPIVDPHHHMWNDERGTYLVDELMEDINTGHNIVATVFVETELMYHTAGPTALQPVGEVEFVSGIAVNADHGKPHLCAGIVGHADLRLGDRVQPVLEALLAASNGRLRGIRDHVRWDANLASTHDVPPHLMADSAFRRGYACLQPLGLSFDVSQFYTQLPELADLLHTFPDTNVIVNHFGGLLGLPPHHQRDQVFAVWRGHIRELAQFANLRVKLGGLGNLRSGWDFHLRDVPPSSQELADAWRPYVETCIETLGASRCMIESNFPQDKQTCGYGVLWNAMKRITQRCSAAEKRALYHDTAARAYSI